MKMLAEQSTAEQSKAEQSRAEKSSAEQSRAEQSRAEQGRAEKRRAEQSRAEQSRAEQSRQERSRAENSRAQLFLGAVGLNNGGVQRAARRGLNIRRRAPSRPRETRAKNVPTIWHAGVEKIRKSLMFCFSAPSD